MKPEDAPAVRCFILRLGTLANHAQCYDSSPQLHCKIHCFIETFAATTAEKGQVAAGWNLKVELGPWLGMLASQHRRLVSVKDPGKLVRIILAALSPKPFTLDLES